MPMKTCTCSHAHTHMLFPFYIFAGYGHTPKEREVNCLIGAPVVLDVWQLDYAHIQDYSNEGLHVLQCDRLPCFHQATSWGRLLSNPVQGIPVGFPHMKLPHLITKKDTEVVLWRVVLCCHCRTRYWPLEGRDWWTCVRICWMSCKHSHVTSLLCILCSRIIIILYFSIPMQYEVSAYLWPLSKS